MSKLDVVFYFDFWCSRPPHASFATGLQNMTSLWRSAPPPPPELPEAVPTDGAAQDLAC